LRGCCGSGMWKFLWNTTGRMGGGSGSAAEPEDS
jgi:hypothetical protein